MWRKWTDGFFKYCRSTWWTSGLHACFSVGRIWVRNFIWLDTSFITSILTFFFFLSYKGSGLWKMPSKQKCWVPDVVTVQIMDDGRTATPPLEKGSKTRKNIEMPLVCPSSMISGCAGNDHPGGYLSSCMKWKGGKRQSLERFLFKMPEDISEQTGEKK